MTMRRLRDGTVAPLDNVPERLAQKDAVLQAEQAEQAERDQLAAALARVASPGRTSLAQIREDLELLAERVARLEGVHDRLPPEEGGR